MLHQRVTIPAENLSCLSITTIVTVSLLPLAKVLLKLLGSLNSWNTFMLCQYGSDALEGVYIAHNVLLANSRKTHQVAFCT